MDDEIFEPHVGRVRTAGSRRSRSYLGRILSAAARSGTRSRRGRSYSGSRFGRGGVTARALGMRDRFAGLRSRRAIVKTRLVHLGAKGIGAAQPHLRYIQRDGVTRDGEPGRLYSAGDNDADGRAFLGRCNGDRHQFRLIVSAEDGAEYEDLRPLVRRFMAHMETDLGTSLDWVAADHVDTLHPHTHIMLRGVDDRGENLVIAPDYLRHGMRERLAGLVSLDLGPRTDFEIQRRLLVDVDAERLTALDRTMIREAGETNKVLAVGKTMFDHSIRTGRLRKLEVLGFAEPLEGGRWRLDDDLDDKLRRLGERGDIIRTMQRALSAARLERGPADQIVFAPDRSASVIGKVVSRGLSNEVRDRHYLIVDGIDGRSHYVDIGNGSETEPLPSGAIVRVSPRPISTLETDRRIAAIAAAHDGRFSVAIHLAAEPGASQPFAEAHVRRLEAVRRSVGEIERSADGSWSIPANYLDLARRHEKRRAQAKPVVIELLSAHPLERLPQANGATWLDRRLVSKEPDQERESGFGHEVRSALTRRLAWLEEQGLARDDHGTTRFAPHLLKTLERRELASVGRELAKESGKTIAELHPGMRVEGVVSRRLDLVSGRFALIENTHELALVPWRPVLERALGRQASGKMSASGGISWSIGRKRGIER